MILGVYGYHKSGKTLFLENMMDELKRRDISAAAIKHLGIHYKEDYSTDTGRLAKVGYNPVVGVTNSAMMMRLARSGELQSTVSLINLISDVDIIFAEGFKKAPIEKIAVGNIKELPGTVMHLPSVLSEQFNEVANYIVERIKQEKRESVLPSRWISSGQARGKITWGVDVSKINLKIMVNGKKLPTNQFVKTMFWQTLSGMMRSLKGVDPEINRIEITAYKE